MLSKILIIFKKFCLEKFGQKLTVKLEFNSQHFIQKGRRGDGKKLNRLIPLICVSEDVFAGKIKPDHGTNVCKKKGENSDSPFQK
jgi:hypothetical protein